MVTIYNMYLFNLDLVPSLKSVCRKKHIQNKVPAKWLRLTFVCALLFFLLLSLTVCEMTVSLSFAQSHFILKGSVVPHDLFPPWSVPGVGVQLLHPHDKWFRKLPHCSLTNRKHTRMLSTSIFHPMVLHFPAPVVLTQRAGEARRGWQNVENLGTGVERQSELGLGCPSLSAEIKGNNS